ncbi:ABC-F family ATP-binding cassette domain-containing protein, partial [Bacillus cereus]|nr:ABC-F family ATP-binding cassette domain-containing protein [Bacillus cereus]
YEGKKPLFQHASFDLKRGDTVALIGPNGIGKSTLLKCLTGSLKPAAGSIHWGTKIKIGLYDQEQTNLNPANTVLEELWSEYPHMEEARIRTVLG